MEQAYGFDGEGGMKIWWQASRSVVWAMAEKKEMVTTV